jgi:hypothetical protein
LPFPVELAKEEAMEAKEMMYISVAAARFLFVFDDVDIGKVDVDVDGDDDGDEVDGWEEGMFIGEEFAPQAKNRS